jgi:uncharacterized protein YjcR
MKAFDPASIEFDTLPRERQATILRHEFGWDTKALADEYGVSATTIREWTSPGARERKRAAKHAYLRTDRGRQKRREQVSRYRANLKTKSELT